MARASVWERAWKDTEHFRESAKSYWLVEVVGAAIFGVGGGFVGYWRTPVGTTSLQEFAYPTIGAAIGIILGFVIVFALIFAWYLFRAPYRQRDEAYALLDAKPQSVPLANRDNLIRAIGELSQKANQTILWQEMLYKLNIRSPFSVNTPEVNQAEQAAIAYEEAQRQLEREKLVASGAFTATIEQFRSEIERRVSLSWHTNKTNRRAYAPNIEERELADLATSAVQQIDAISRLL